MFKKLLEYIPHGNTLDDEAWAKRHRLLLWVLFIHVPGLFLFGLIVGRSLSYTAWAVVAPLACVLGGWAIKHRRFSSFLVTVGLVYCSSALVGLSLGSIEAHFHFFIMIGFIALYQDWVPFLWNIGFTVLSHGLGSIMRTDLIFDHPAGQGNPWLWSAIHGGAVLLGCAGVVIFWRHNEEEQKRSIALTGQLAEAEVAQRRFTSDLLVNLARRNQSLLYRQLAVINQLEEQEKDPDALAELFRLDHFATRIRRNAESLLVLSGEKSPRTWSKPVPLVDIVRAAIAETEDLDRVVFVVDDQLAVAGQAVADLTHLLAELVENAVRFSPPESSVSVRSRPYVAATGGHVLTVEDWGVGMRPEDLQEINELLARPRDVDLSVSQRLGMHVVSRLAQRHAIQVSLTPTPGGGTTAVVLLPPALMAPVQETPEPVRAGAATAVSAPVAPAVGSTRPGAMAAYDPADGGLTNGHPHPQPHPTRRRDLFGDRQPGGAKRNGAPPADAGESGRPPTILPPIVMSTDGPGVPPGPTARTAPPVAGATGRLARPQPDQPEPHQRPSRVARPEPEGPRRPPRDQAPSPPAPPPHAPAAAGPDTGNGGNGGPAGGGDPGMPHLARRVPQSHIAPQLRQPLDDTPTFEAPPPGQGPLPSAAQARSALSRYQASRKAATRALIDGDARGGDAKDDRGDWS